MKAIIPVAGAGTRLRPFTYTQPKPLIPVAGKPILSYIIDQLVELGVKEFVFVIGYLGEQVREYVTTTYPHLEQHFIVQKERRGSGHAVWLAAKALGDTEEVIVVFGDTILEGKLDHIIQCNTTCMAIKAVDDPRRFGVVELTAESRITRMVEKPRMPRSNKALVGFYKISKYSELHAALGQILESNATTEVTLTDGLMAMLDTGHEMHAAQVERWYDCGDPEVLLHTNKVLLSKRGYAESEPPAFDGTIFIHPVSVGKDCQIQHAIIGPHVSIGDGVVIERTILSDSIIGRRAQLRHISLQHSVVGNDTKLTGQPRTINIGEHTELSIS